MRQNCRSCRRRACNRFQTEYGLPEYDAEVLTSDKALAHHFVATVQRIPATSPKQVSNWIMDDPTSMSTITPATSGTLLTLVEKGTISRNQAKKVFKEMVATGKDPEAIIKEKGLIQISDTGALEAVAQEIIDANPKEAADYRGGKTKVMGFFVGQLMKKTKGQANPQLANEIFQRVIGERLKAQRIYLTALRRLRGINHNPPCPPLEKGGKTENRKRKPKTGEKMIPYCSICWDVDKVKLLDQRRLPAEELYLEIRDYHEIIEAIRTLAIRGAPAIGVAAAMGAALGALEFGYP